MTLYVAAVMARFLTSKLFSLIQAETIGWKYGSSFQKISGRISTLYKLVTLTSGDHRSDGETTPFVSTLGQLEQRNQQRQTPKLADDTVPGSLGETFAAPSQRQHEDDLKNGRWNRQHVAIENRKADASQRERKICLHWRGRNICHKADEIQAPHRLVSPSVLDVLPCGRIFQSRQTLCRIIAQDPIDHDDFLLLGVPWLAPQGTLGAGWGKGQIEPTEDPNDKREKTFKLRFRQQNSNYVHLKDHLQGTARTNQVSLQYRASAGYLRQATKKGL